MHQADDTDIPKRLQALFGKYWGWGWGIKAGINCHYEEVLVGVTDRNRKQVGSTYQTKPSSHSTLSSAPY